MVEDAVTGAPSSVGSHRGFLTGANGEGRTVRAATASAFAVEDRHRAVKAFIEEHRKLFGHGAEALAAARIVREDVTPASGLRTVVWEQVVDGIPVFEGRLQAGITRRGELVSIGSRFVAAPDAAAGRGRPRMAARRAVALAAAQTGAAVEETAVASAEDPAGAALRQKFTAPKLSDTTAELTWLPMNETSMRQCWSVTFTHLARGEMFRVLVDAETGEALVRRCLTNYISDASYRVYTSDSPSPFSPGHPTPLTIQPPVVARTLVTTPALNVTASPNGWIDDGVNETRGNNVDAHTDLDANNVADLPRPQGSPFRVFDFALDLNQEPTTYRDAAVTQLFYLCNFMHDKLYALGFTEASGNFQNNNFGRGGTGNDAVQADAQDGSGTNNANFSTPPDGSPGRMQMYIFPGPTPDRDGDFDAEIVLHEYTHGLSNRLVGGGVGISQLQTGGMGEGWSDFYGLSLLSEAGDSVSGNYAAGGYATYQFSGQTTNYYFGIRRYPYSTDLTKNPLTFKDIDPAQQSAHTGVPRGVIGSSDGSEVHNEGEVWCVTLWDARANLINKLGYAVGNQLMLQLVTDGMKLAPANPNFLQARDAIVQADLVLTGGAHHDELWAAFAKRGMGASASSPASNTTTGVVEAFDLPDALSVSPLAGFASSGPVGGPFTVTASLFTLTNTSATAISWTASADAGWLTLSQSSGALASGASTTVTVSLDSGAQSLPAGIYAGAVTFYDVTTGLSQTRNFTLKIGQPDFFTELFDTSANDTANQSFLFAPNGSTSFYAATRAVAAAFPTDPAGGTTLTLSDDSNAVVTLTGASVSLYGTSFTSFYVGSNGYVTFGAGDTGYSESLASHFASRRIAALYDDLNPSAGGTVSWRQLADRAAVTFQNVPEYGTNNSNNFQIELFFDGRIRITILSIAATDGLIGLSRGTGLPAGFAESDFSAYPTVVVGLIVALPASATEGDPAQTGTVTASPAPAADLVVALGSNMPSRATVPASVTILAGQTSATFALTIGDDAVLNGTASVVVAASASGYAGGSAVISIFDNETATLSVSLPASATEGDGSVQGTVTVSAVPAAAIAVSLTSSDPSAALPPAVVLIPAGQISVSFSLAIIDDTKLNGTHAATITAHVANWTDGSASIDVQDNENTILGLALPAAVLEGAPLSGTVSISGTLPGNLTVALMSDNTAQVTVPASVTITAGQTSASFTVSAVNDTLVDGTQNATITASAGGFSSSSGIVSAIDNEVDHFLVGAIASPKIRNAAFAVPITARNINDITITNYSATVNFTAAGSSGAVPISPASASGFVSGVLTANIAATAFATGVVLTVNDGAGHTGVSNAFDVGTGALDHFGWNAIASPRTFGVPFNATVSAQDVGNNTVSTFTGTAALNCGGPTKITGTGTTTTSNFPLYTFYHDERTQCIYLPSELGGPGRISAIALFVTTVPGQTMNAWTIRMKHSALTSYAPAAWDAAGWTTVHQSNQTVTTTGWVTFPLTTPFDYNGTSSLLIDFSFNNSSFTTQGICTTSATAATRTIYYFADSAFGDPLTWSGTTNPTPLTALQIPNLRVQYDRSVPIAPTTTGAFTAGVWTGSIAVNQIVNGVTLAAVSGAVSGESNVFNVTGAPVLDVSPATGLASAGNFGGPFTPVSAAYTLTNSGTGPMNWTAAKTAPWLTLSATGGTLAPGATATVTATLAASALEPGGYNDAITFTNTTNGVGNTTRAVALTVVLPAPAMLAEPPFTGGTSNTVAWSAVSGATSYDAQRATAADFSDAVSAGPLAATSNVFASLADGVLYRYRARARRSTSVSWTQTTQADFDADVKNNVASTAGGDVVLGGGTTPTGTIVNASFEDTAFGGWTKSFSNSVMGVQPANLADFPPMPTLGAYYAGFFTFHNNAQAAGSFARITQSVDFTGARALLFDAVLGKRTGSTWANSVSAELRVDGATLWSATGEGAYLNQAVDISGFTGTHIVELREQVLVAGAFNAQWVLFDNLRLSGTAYVPAGMLTSTAIAPASWLQWGALTFTRDISAAGSALTVDVLGTDNTLLAANVGSGTNLNTLAAVASRPAIKLRANLSTSNSALTPRLSDWTVGYSTSSASDALSAWSAAVASTQDATAPAVIVTSASTAYGPAYRVSGMASDVSGVSALTVNGTSASSSDGFAHWSAPATLALGGNSFTIVALDSVTPANTRVLTFNVNRNSADANANGLPDAWEALYGGPGADPNHNGRINLLEFALGLDPVNADIGALPGPVLVPDIGDGHVYLTWSFRRRTDWSGLSYIPEVSTVLAVWENGAGHVQTVGAPAPNPDGVTETVTVRALPPADIAGAPHFIRLRVTAP